MTVQNQYVMTTFLTVWLMITSQLFATPQNSQQPSTHCQAVLEFLNSQPNLNWIKADYSLIAARGEIRPADFDNTMALRELPSYLRDQINHTNKNGLWQHKVTTLTGLRNWAERKIKKRITNLARAPEGLRQLDLWMHDKNGKEAGFAIRQFLKPDVGYFGVGHGMAGGDVHAIYPFTIQGKPVVVVEIQVEPIITLFSKLPAVKKSRFIFYKTCSGGLPGEKSEANAIQLARESGVPVIAPMGVLVNNCTGFDDAPPQWRTWVEEEETEKLLHRDESFRVFLPDGTSKRLTFDKMKSLLFKKEFHSNISYSDEQDQ